jgi:hypothetical protein
MKVLKIVIVVIVACVAIIAIVGAVRLISGEDNWMCENGMWVRHGNPSAPMPVTLCPPVDVPEEFTPGPD